MGALKVLCVILPIYVYMYGTYGLLSLPENKASDRTGLLPSTVSGKASNVLRDILNQESLVRFSMVQKIQNLVMEAIDNKNDKQNIKMKLNEMTKELQDLETKSQMMKEENIKLKEELKVVYGEVNDNRNFTMEEIQRLNQTEILIKSKTVALHEENIELALKNADIQKQLDLLNKTINLKIQGLEIDISETKNNSQNLKQIQNDVKKDIKSLKLSDQGTLVKIRSLNESQMIFVKNHLRKMKELGDVIRNDTVVLIKDNDRAFAKKTEVLKDQMNKMNATLQKSGVDILTGRFKTTEDMFSSFSVYVNETLDNVREDLNETKLIVSNVSINLMSVLSIKCNSCWDILRKFPSSKGEDGVYTISIASEVKSVYCDMSTDGGGWTAIQRRQDGSRDFYRTWSDYKQGFGDPSKNYWIGNDAIYELTKNKDQELRVELQSFDGAEAYAQYSTFYVGDEGSKYRLTVSGYSGTAGDSLTYHNGTSFTTKDQDNDDYSDDNCATMFQGGWWYNACIGSNLNGGYAQSAVNSAKYTSWYEWKKKHEALQKTLMMIRKKV